MNHCTVLPEMSDVPNQRHDQPEPVLLCSDNKYKCEICNMKFKTLSIFRCHLLIHNNIRPFPCSTCPKSFRTRYALINHERIHSNEKPFVCDICLKSFRQVTHMKHHRMRHTNDMPVKCPECQMGFITKFRLREHLRKDHYTMKAFKCAECPEEFFLKYDLKRHARLIHLRSVSVADSDNENVKNVPEGSSESETYLPVENNDGDNGDGEHYNDIAALYDTDRVGNANIEEHQNNNENSNKESNTDIINIAEDTDIEPEEEEEEDDDVRIIEPDESNAIINNIHTREQSDQIVEEDTSCSNIFFLNDVDSPLTPPETQSNENLREEEQEVSCGPQIGHFGLGSASPSVTQPPTIPLSNEKDEEDNTYATSNEPVIDNIQLDSSSSCDSPPPPQTCATTSNYFNIEQEEEIHITEEEIETYTTSTSTYYNVQDITQS